MAYRAFDAWQPMAAAEPQDMLSSGEADHDEAREPVFDAAELSVLALARLDGLDTLRVSGRVIRFLDALFGLHRQFRLANPRLEALRRFAVLAFRGKATPQDTASFLDAGFSGRAADLILSHSR